MCDLVTKLLALADKAQEESDKIDEAYRILQELYFQVPHEYKETVKKVMDLLED